MREIRVVFSIHAPISPADDEAFADHLRNNLIDRPIPPTLLMQQVVAECGVSTKQCKLYLTDVTVRSIPEEK